MKADLYPSERGEFIDEEGELPERNTKLEIGPSVGDFGGPCPCCGGRVERYVCEKCGWDEFGENVFLRERTHE